MQIKKLRRFGAVVVAGAAVVAGVIALAAPASADPVGTPGFRALNGAGSDTTQDLNNGLASVVTYGGSLVLGSFDATIPSGRDNWIQTRAGGTWIPRPNGSVAGIAALRSAKEGGYYPGGPNSCALYVPQCSFADSAPTTTTAGQNKGAEDTSLSVLTSNDLQFARSSIGATYVSGGAYAYIPLALDAVTYATSSSTTVPTNLTKADLKAIYLAANNTNVTLSDGLTYKVGIPGTSGVQIVPIVPQAGSGTRSSWQAQIVGGGSFGTAVSDTYTVNGADRDVQVNDGSVLAAVPNALVPFSIAQYIAQSNSSTLSTNYGITVADRRNGAVLRSVNGVAPTVLGRLNTSFPISRPVFTVVQKAELSSNAALAAVFQGSTASAYNALRPGSSSNLVITDFGFGDIRTGVTIGGVTYTAGDTTSFLAN